MADRWVTRWTVPSDSKPDKSYTVAVDKEGNYGCSCPRWKFHREECKHIAQVKRGDYEPNSVVPIEEPSIVLANVREVTPDNGRLLVPLIPIGHTHFQATLIYDMLQHGVSWGTCRARYEIAKRNPRKAILTYVEERGRCIYGPWQEGRGYVGFTVVPISSETGS